MKERVAHPAPIGGAQRSALAARDPLAAALLPVVLHELANHTQYLSALNALLTAGDATPSGLDELGRTAREIEDLGWLLALTAAVHGADLLYERRERAALTSLVRVLHKVVRREGRDLERPERTLPEIPTDCTWLVPWAIGSWILAAARARPERSALVFEIESADGRVRVGVATDTDLLECAHTITQRLPAARFTRENGHQFLSVEVPAQGPA